MQMTFYIQKKKFPGLKEKESITQIHMEQDALFQVLSQQILPKVLTLRFLYSVQKDYISRALADMLDLGAGSGPMNHAFDLKDEWKEEA